jgi:hypothetical protein
VYRVREWQKDGKWRQMCGCRLTARLAALFGVPCSSYCTTRLRTITAHSACRRRLCLRRFYSEQYHGRSRTASQQNKEWRRTRRTQTQSKKSSASSMYQFEWQSLTRPWSRFRVNSYASVKWGGFVLAHHKLFYTCFTC